MDTYKDKGDKDTYSLMAKAEEVIPNRFLLSRILTKRIRQLNRGYKPKIKVDEKTPSIETALKEIIGRKLQYVGVDKSEIQP